MGFQALLLRLAMMVLQEVMEDITQQQTRVANQGVEVTNRFTNLLGQPDFWDGDDADRVKGELMRLAVPSLEKVTGVCKRTNDGLTEAVNIVTTADRKVAQLVNSLNSEFSSIY
ncbi:MAG: hypothetical protein SGI73_07360 [Chloroflexota bacterium]|nr:hypothetical protein [Chloroflexota bacterium]